MISYTAMSKKVLLEKVMSKKIAITVLAVLAISVIANIVFVYNYGGDMVTSLTATSTDDGDSSTYPLLSKRIFADSQSDIIINFIPLRKALNEYVGSQNGNVGVYFEYLPSGVSISANGTKEYRLASLSKVPLVMSVLRKVENGKLHMNDTVTLTQDDLDSAFGDLWKKGAGTSMSVKDLIEICLQHSDNTAYNALFRMLTPAEIMDVYDNLDIEVTSVTTNPSVSPKSYSSIFRSLFLASYLNNKDSHYVLTVLTKTIFHDKIPAGVPSNILVAHKIGVFDRVDSKDKVYTDCGVVYVPNRPYILCAFVDGSDDDAKKDISYVSNMVYSYMTIAPAGN